MNKKALYSALIPVMILLLFSMTSDNPAKTLHDFKAKTLDGKDFDFASLKGKKVLIVNVASECGYTPQYKGLQELYEKYDSTGKFTIIGFPCNQFGGQEPGSATDIQTFCTKNYGVTFPMMEKVDVKGDKQNSVYGWLTHKALNGVEDSEVTWNFNKYLIDENGKYVKHLSSKVEPMSEEITKWIEGK
jgi:glutathione peroxidase